jgi:ElaB/YqjD/DUF883 family membrane-anchored ribosome-binding protein
MELNTTKVAKETYNGATKAADQALDRAKDMIPSLESRYEAIKDGASEGFDTAVSTVKKYPLYAVLGSTALGLLAGMLIARRKN